MRRNSDDFESAIAHFEAPTRHPEQQRQQLRRVITASAARASEAGVDITGVMQRVTETVELLGMSEGNAYKCFLREAAVDSSVKRALRTHSFLQPRAPREYALQDYVRLALQGSEATEYDEILAKADRAVQVGLNKSVYVVQVMGYKKEGVELVLSMSNPISGETFSARVEVGTLVAEVMKVIQNMRFHEVAHVERLIQGVSGSYVNVKLLGPAGTLLDPAKFLPEALDYETDVVTDDVQQGEYYPLEMLVGQAWKNMGLDGPTRWKHVEDTLFMQLFGMSKASFEQLPTWKQIPLKRKHGLF